ncbi:hypothetical protein EMIT0324P_20508 [Pseudomonas chlororaphis]
MPKRRLSGADCVVNRSLRQRLPLLMFVHPFTEN